VNPLALTTQPSEVAGVARRNAAGANVIIASVRGHKEALPFDVAGLWR
jgi:hypothetical protein